MEDANMKGASWIGIKMFHIKSSMPTQFLKYIYCQMLSSCAENNSQNEEITMST